MALIVVAYVALVLGVDTLAALRTTWPIDWTVFRWGGYHVHAAAQGLGLPAMLTEWLRKPPAQAFDWFKFLTWFAIPFLFCIWRMDWGSLGFKRWKCIDIALLAVLVVLGMAAVLLVPLIPSLRETYHGTGRGAPSARMAVVVAGCVWVFSWLLGWEFLHRYVLLRRAVAQWPRYGWLLVPLSEGLYHLQKPGIEALGMVAVSLVLTYWAMKRQNVLLPFLFHLAVEIELIVFLAFQ